MTAMPAQTGAAPSVRTVSYGGDPSQVADLHLPAGVGAPSSAGRWPVVIVVHGGYWGSGYGRDLGDGLAADLARHGVAAWNIEYRRIGRGGGWPNTFLDVAAAVDALAVDELAASLDLRRVAAVGHSAGGQLAMWLAARHTLPPSAPGARPVVRVGGIVSQAGVLDLVRGAQQGLGGGAVIALLGGPPEAVPERYAVASPYALLPIGVRSTLVHGLADDVVPIEQSDRYAAAARSLGDHVDECRLPGVDHFALIDPSTSAWASCRNAVLDYVSTSSQD
jgi:acetyl esterase/lipase